MLVLLGIFEFDLHNPRDIVISRIDGQLYFFTLGWTHLEVLLICLFIEDYIDAD